MRVSAVGVRTIAIFAVWLVWTVILMLNIPEHGETDTMAFGGFAILWMIATMLGGMMVIIQGWQYFWERAPDIADWINEQISG